MKKAVECRVVRLCPSSAAASQLPLEGLSALFTTSVLCGLYTVVKS